MTSLIRLLLVLAMVVPLQAAITYLPTWSWTTLSNAYVSATSGDTIILGPGTNVYNGQGFLWASKKSINLLGAGTNQTRLYATNVTTLFNITDADTNNPTINISDIFFDLAVNPSSGFGISAGYNPPATSPFPARLGIYRNYFNLRTRTTISVGFGGGFGYISKNVFLKNPGSQPSGNHIITGGNEWPSWEAADPTGTTNMWFIEDNYFQSEKIGANWYPSNGHFDGYRGGQAMYRSNYFQGNANTGAHGYDSDVVSMRYLGLFNNIFTNMQGDNYPALTRGGIIDAVNNKVYSSSANTNINSFGAQYYRSAWGAFTEGSSSQGVDRTNRYTGNVLSATASSITVTNVPLGIQYRFDQVASHTEGWPGFLLMTVGGTGSGQTRIISSSTIWNNTFGQTQPGTVTFVVSTNWTVTPDSTTTFQLCPWPGVALRVANLDDYTFTTNTPASVNRQVKVELNPDGTPNVGATMTNLMLCINGTGTNGVNYFFSASRIAQNQAINWDMVCLAADTNMLVLHNKLDGSGFLGYPGSQQEGVVQALKGTNTGVVLRPCISVSNYVNDVTLVGIVPTITIDSCPSCPGGVWPFFNTNSVIDGRDLTNLTSWPYGEVPYPYLPFVPNDAVITLSSSGATATLTGSEDLFAGSGAGSRTYHVGQELTFTAPGAAEGKLFSKWTRAGVDYSTDATITLTNTGALALTAVYTNAATLVWLFTIQSSPSTGVSVTNTVDNLGTTNGLTDYTLFYNDTTNVTLTASVASDIGRFKYWLKDGVFNSINPSISVTATADATYTAVYRDAQETEGNVVYTGNIKLE